MNIGFIGLGVMGASMARHIIKNGYTVYGYNRHIEKAEALKDEGLVVCPTVKEVALNSDVVITMVGFPKDVEEVYFNDEGILNNIKEGSYVIDMTTSSPQLAQRISEEAKKRHLHALDAPVSGGDSGAQSGTLAIMVGGDETDFAAMKPLLATMGNNIVYEGSAGAGQHTKMANQIAIAGALSGAAEAIAYARAAGLDLTKMIDTISSGAAGGWQLNNLGRKMIAGDFAPGFYIKHFIKDMRIADNEAKSRDLTLNVLETVLKMDESLEEDYGNEGTQALIKYYDR